MYFRSLRARSATEVKIPRAMTSGWIDRLNVWLCEGGEVVLFSQGNGQQEAFVLRPAFGWLHGGKGNFLNAATRQPWMAELVQ